MSADGGAKHQRHSTHANLSPSVIKPTYIPVNTAMSSVLAEPLSPNITAALRCNASAAVTTSSNWPVNLPNCEFYDVSGHLPPFCIEALGAFSARNRFVWTEGDILRAVATKHNPIINNSSKQAAGGLRRIWVGREKSTSEKRVGETYGREDNGRRKGGMVKGRQIHQMYGREFLV